MREVDWFKLPPIGDNKKETHQIMQSRPDHEQVDSQIQKAAAAKLPGQGPWSAVHAVAAGRAQAMLAARVMALQGCFDQALSDVIFSQHAREGWLGGNADIQDLGEYLVNHAHALNMSHPSCTL